MRAIFSSDANPAVLGDWMELELVLSGRSTISDAVLRRADVALAEPEHAELDFDPDAGEHGEYLDAEIVDSRDEARQAAVWEELKRRQDALQELYPFVLVADKSGGWSLHFRRGGDRSAFSARCGYIAALVMSSFKHQHIQKHENDDGCFERLLGAIPWFFQALSAFAASNLLGAVYWFGWPRPDHSGFREALKNVLALLGHGKLREPAPINRRSIKDATVDIIAWRTFGDNLYGSLIVYGQVASGANWRTKPIRAFLEGDFLDHFSDPPSAQYLEALFMPFTLQVDLVVPRDGDMTRAIEDEARQLEKNFGIVVDRIRLTQLLAQGTADAEGMFNCPDFLATEWDVRRWVRACSLYCAEAA